jgi:hypothetical protein
MGALEKRLMRQPEIPFRFEIPLDAFWKAGEKGKERRIGGIISTDSKDRQGEQVVQRGLDFSEFLSNGWFNDNHSRETTGIVGYPTEVKPTVHKGRKAHYVEGYLLDDYDRSDEIWRLANSLQKTGRRLGFSIEGSVTRREGDRGSVIAAAKVRNVAITNCPVNTDTGLEVLAKSLMAMETEGEDQLRQAMMAGQAVSNPGAAPGEGFPLRVESMEREPKVVTHRRQKKKLLSKAEAIRFLQQRYRGMTPEMAERILDHVRTRSV